MDEYYGFVNPGIIPSSRVSSAGKRMHTNNARHSWVTPNRRALPNPKAYPKIYASSVRGSDRKYDRIQYFVSKPLPSGGGDNAWDLSQQPSSAAETEPKYTIQIRRRDGRYPAALYQALDLLLCKAHQVHFRLGSQQDLLVCGIPVSQAMYVMKKIIDVVDIDSEFSQKEPICHVRYSEASLKYHAEPLLQHAEDFVRLWEGSEKVAEYSSVHNKRYTDHFADCLFGESGTPQNMLQVGMTLEGDASMGVYADDIGLIALQRSEQGEHHISGFNIVLGGSGVAGRPLMARLNSKSARGPNAAMPFASIASSELTALVCSLHKVMIQTFPELPASKQRFRKVIQSFGGVSRLYEVISSAPYNVRLSPFVPSERRLSRPTLSLDSQDTISIPVTSGILEDQNERRLRSALRLLTDKYKLTIRIPSHWQVNDAIVLQDIQQEDMLNVAALLREHGIETGSRQEDEMPMACCAGMPTCHRALVDTRKLGSSIRSSLLSEIKQAGIQNTSSVTVRVDACQSGGCTKAPFADVGLVSVSADAFDIYVGGSPTGSLCGFRWESQVKRNDITAKLKPLFGLYRERLETLAAGRSKLGPLKATRASFDSGAEDFGEGSEELESTTENNVETEQGQANERTADFADTTPSFGEFCSEIGSDKLNQMVKDKKPPRKHRISLRTSTMERLHVIAELHDMSPSKVAHEVFTAYFASMKDPEMQETFKGIEKALGEN
eukprot:CAMPEP_0184694594 /NCGR_PEP_ID=MMETSP0313-20130426/2484_1 /TAXON_ID=2792 /ORGANISM="Porphyridium aerugineum, Strain SAG 1380-2" /LENGTH=722 /DNA_ID=CAMNT_0027152899 /DNA_START=105 /DNA_END=2270 /DNA_ORIENTATION=+